MTRLRSALPMLVLAVVACRDESPAAIDLITLVPEGSSQVILQQEPGPAPGTYTYIVRVLSRGTGMASVQGSVSFAPGSLELLGTSTPEGGEGVAYLVNPVAAEGRLRFAAFAPEAFTTDEVFRFSARHKASLETIAFQAELEAAGVTEGTALDAKTFRKSEGVRDRGGRVILR